VISAWVLYLDIHGDFHFEQCEGTDFTSTNPTDWGLVKANEIILVFQRASFIQAWIEGKPLKEY